MNIIIASDLHLSVKDKDYSLPILEEILTYAIASDGLFLLGDIFDSYADAEEFRNDFRRMANSIQTPIYFIAGNHEKIASIGRMLEQLNLGDRVVVMEGNSYSRFYIGGLDIIALPYQNKYDNYYQWDMGKKDGTVRILLSHGIVEGSMWFLNKFEDSTAAIPIDLLNAISCDVAILGHIHQKFNTKIKTIDGDIDIVYPGSSKICRLSETEVGEKYILSLRTQDNALDIDYIALEKAGKYLTYEFNINSGVENSLIELSKNWKRKDIIEIRISGVVENDSVVDKIVKNIEGKYRKLVSKLIITRKNISILNNIFEENILSEFLSVAENYKKEKEGVIAPEILELAKIKGVEKIAAAIKLRK